MIFAPSLEFPGGGVAFPSAGRLRLTTGGKQCMKDLLSILRDAPGSIRLEVSGEDLLAFSKSLIDRAKEELAAQVAEARKERYLTKEQVKELCGVCDATLWHWNRKGYLKAVKVGNKVRYRTSDIQRILGERDGK